MAKPPQQQASGVIPVYPGGAILLLLRDDRPEIGAPNRWGLLGGHLEVGETPEQAAWRELEEETGRRAETLLPTGYLDHPSLQQVGVTVRSHIFATAVNWTLDDLIIGEGQRFDWFTPDQALQLPLVAPLVPVVEWFLASDLYRRLTGDGPVLLPPLPGALSPELPGRLGLRPGTLLAVQGVTAGLVRRLWDVLPGGVRVTASLGAAERPEIVLWQPRDEPPAEVFDVWQRRLGAGGILWVIPQMEDITRLRSSADAAGWGDGEPCELPSIGAALRFRRGP